MSKNLPAVPPTLADRDGLAIIGRTLHDLRGIRFEDGPGGGTPAPAPAPAPAPQPAPTPTPAPAPAPAPTPTPAPAPAPTPAPTPAPQPTPPAADDPEIHGPVGDVPFDQLPAATQAEVRRLRLADRAARERAREQESAATRAAELESRATAAERANMVLLQAPDAGANPRTLLDSVAFQTYLGTQDVSDTAKAKTAIENWLKDHPEHRASTAAPSSGGTRPQGGAPGQTKPGLEGAVASRIKAQN